jgi:macrolide transport system ATP-binding/permease protein
MRLRSIFRHRLRTLFAREKVERELDEELQYHVDRQIDEYVASGMPLEDARYAALRSIGALEQRKEECRDMRGLNTVDNVVQDFRYAVRQLRKSPGFTCTATFVLALGISAAAAIFALVEAALIQPLPYRDQSRLVGAFAASPAMPRLSLSYLGFADWKQLNHCFASIDAYALNGGFTLSTAEGAEQVTGTRISAGFFRTLGVTPAKGRDFLPDEDSPAAAHAVILSYAAWQARFGGREDVLGQAVTLNGIPRTIVGVLPREFHFAPAGQGEFWATLRRTDSCEQRRGCQNLHTVARLRDGISMESATAEMQGIARQLQSQYPDTNRDMGSATVAPLRDVIVGEIRPVLLMLLSGAGVLLLIAFLNVSTLLLARSDSRRREIAVRGSLGATSARLFHQFALEGLVLAAAGGTLGLIFAEWGMRLLASLVPAQKMYSMPWLRGLGSNLHTVAFAGSLALLAGVLFAVIPTARISLSKTLEGLKEGTRGGAGLTWRRFGANLVVVEVALAMVLMATAGLLGKSLYALLHVDTGMNPDRLASVGLKWPLPRYASDEKRVTLGRQMVERISALPGVTSAAISLTSPLGTPWASTSFHVSGRPNHGETNGALHRQVSSGYFATLQARLIRGRYFRDAEDASKPRVAIVNRSLAKKYFPGEDPIGKQIYHDWAPLLPMEIVGIIDDIKEGQLENEDPPVLYVPFDQRPVDWFAVLVRTSSAERSVLTSIVEAIHQIDREISVSNPVTMTQRIHNSPAAYLHRSSAWLVGSFAGIAFVLGVVGLYGVVAYSVSQRTREIGIRMALGAAPGSVCRLIVEEAARLVGLGTVLGIGGSLAAAALIRGLFFGVRTWDAATLAVVGSIIVVAALLASYIPARRAASVNPVEALRSE